MITVLVNDCNQFSQSFYDSITSNLQWHQVRCSCGHAGCLTIHGYYYRSVHSRSGSYLLRILRMKCSECGRTHAILLSSFVPYNQISLEDQRLVVEAFEHREDVLKVCTPEGSLDENNVKAIIRRYKHHWQEKLRAEATGFSPLQKLIRQCFSLYSAQFMQVRCTFNTLFSSTT
jgi:hypothetical protein